MKQHIRTTVFATFFVVFLSSTRLVSCADLCDSGPCLNKGICVELAGIFICHCPDADPGLTYVPGSIVCAVLNSTTSQLDPCASDPCQNGGTCNTATSGFTCTCPSNYMGGTCSSEAIPTMSPDPCSSSPCSNGGACRVMDQGYICDCTSGYTGFICADTVAVKPCASNPCSNSGTCDSSGNSFSCTCSSGFSGTRCAQVVPTSCQPDDNPCLNGGTCTVDGDGFSCSCEPGYTGETCEQVSNTTTSPTSTTNKEDGPTEEDGPNEEDGPTDEGNRGNSGMPGGVQLWVIIAIVVATVIVAFLVILLCFMILRGRSNKSSSASHRPPYHISDFQPERNTSSPDSEDGRYASGAQAYINKAYNREHDESVIEVDSRSIPGNYDPPPAYGDDDDDMSINGGIDKPRIYDNNKFAGTNNFNTLGRDEASSSDSGSMDNGAQLY